MSKQNLQPMIDCLAKRPEQVSMQDVVQNTCFCKLRQVCPDKNHSECYKSRNLLAEFFNRNQG